MTQMVCDGPKCLCWNLISDGTALRGGASGDRWNHEGSTPEQGMEPVKDPAPVPPVTGDGSRKAACAREEQAPHYVRPPASSCKAVHFCCSRMTQSKVCCCGSPRGRRHLGHCYTDSLINVRVPRKPGPKTAVVRESLSGITIKDIKSL